MKIQMATSGHARRLRQRPSALQEPFLAILLFVLLTSCLLVPIESKARSEAETAHHADPVASRLTSQLTGSVPTHGPGRLHVVTSLGNVVIHTQDSEKIDYRVLLEADATQQDAHTLLKSFRVAVRPCDGW